MTHKENRELRIAILRKYDTQDDFAQALTTVGIKRSEVQVSQVLCDRRFICEEEANVWRILLECEFSLLERVIRPIDTMGCLGRPYCLKGAKVQPRTIHNPLRNASVTEK